jgi:hypothetical protein
MKAGLQNSHASCIAAKGLEYGDGIYTLAGADRPSARVISNAIAAQETAELSDHDLSAFIYVWEQFLDHDIDLTSTGTTASRRAPIRMTYSQTEDEQLVFSRDGT